MADLNYMSPSGMQPKVGWTPEGFLGGVKWQEQEKDYKDSLDLQKALSMFGIKKQQNELADYEANSPLREAERRAGITKANVIDQTALREALAGIGQKEGSAAHSNAQARNLDAETSVLPDLRRAQIDKYKTETNAAKHTQLMNIIGSIAAIKGKGTLDLPNSLILNQHFKDLGIDPRSPEAAHIFQDAENIMKRMSKLDPAHISKMEEINATGDWHVRANSARTAQERSDMQMISALEEALKQDPAARNFTPQQIKAAAVRQYLQLRANMNGYRTPETSREKATGEIRGAIDAINELKSGNRNVSPQGTGVPVPPAAPANNAPALPPLPPGFKPD